ncbi:MAG: P1 family peptidase [Clostridia bacterium]|nr:P1 family peptidase [Clostridia bacterium]
MPFRNISDFGINVGTMPKGKHNSICDVEGVKVGHCTVEDENHHTGVTVIMPSEKNPFVYKLPAACTVFNGFGKTAGTIQIEELGTLETPIALTNTLNVGIVHDAIVDYMVTRCEEEGEELRSVNPVVCECNDSHLNKISDRAVKKEHIFEAIEDASDIFEMGAIGAGRGMVCHGLKGGIGSSSRIINIKKKSYTLGVLVLTNHGRLDRLLVDGMNIGKDIAEKIKGNEQDKGSCIIIMATDAPLDSRQIKRVLNRACIGLGRLGSYMGHGSGEVAIGFSTANEIDSHSDKVTRKIKIFNEDYIDDVFIAMSEATEEAILRSMINAEKMTGYGGNTVHSLTEFL